MEEAAERAIPEARDIHGKQATPAIQVKTERAGSLFFLSLEI
jgi:hypothetical protein